MLTPLHQGFDKNEMAEDHIQPYKLQRRYCKVEVGIQTARVQINHVLSSPKTRGDGVVCSMHPSLTNQFDDILRRNASGEHYIILLRL